MPEVTNARVRARFSFSVKINFILGLGLAILVAVGTLAYRSIDELVDASRYEGTALIQLGHLEAFIAQHYWSAWRTIGCDGSTR